MKSLRLHGLDDLQIHEELAPVPYKGQALLKITSVGIPGADLHSFAEQSIGDARLSGAAKIGSNDLLPQQVDAAKALGAHHAILTDGKPFDSAQGKPDVSLILAATRGRDVDVAFEAAGAQAAVNDACAAIVPGTDNTAEAFALAKRREGIKVIVTMDGRPCFPWSSVYRPWSKH